MFVLFGKFAFYIAVPIALVSVYLVSKFLIVKALLGLDVAKIQETPVMLAILHSTLFLNFFSWLRMVPATSYMMWTHAMYLAFFFGASFSAYKTTFSNPGFIPKCTSIEQKQQLVCKLAEDGRLNSREYCVTCMVTHSLNLD